MSAYVKSPRPRMRRPGAPVGPKTIYVVVVTEPADKVGKFVKTAIWSHRRPLERKYNTFFSIESFETFCKDNKYFIREAK